MANRSSPGTQKRQGGLDNFGPDEVQQCIKIAETTTSKQKANSNVLRKPRLFDGKVLELVFECS